MTLKTYSQNCGLAAALDVVGERWTLLILRALCHGPARFSEIQAQLPGIGTNLLAARLKMLSRRGVIEKKGGQQGAYRLTGSGASLRPVLLAMARWGRSFLPVSGGEDNVYWSMFNIEAAFRPERAEGIDAVIEFIAGPDRFHLVIRRCTCRAVLGAAQDPDLVMRSPGPRLVGPGARLQIHGDSAVFDAIRPCFDL